MCVSAEPLQPVRAHSGKVGAAVVRVPFSKTGAYSACRLHLDINMNYADCQKKSCADGVPSAPLILQFELSADERHDVRNFRDIEEARAAFDADRAKANTITCESTKTKCARRR